MRLWPAKGSASKQAIREKRGSNLVFGATNVGHQHPEHLSVMSLMWSRLALTMLSC